MANLILGPLLRRISGDGEAVIWVQTDQPANATVIAGSIVAQAHTVTFDGVHIALVVVSGLSTGPTPYEVHLDGRPVWQEQSVINIPAPGDPLKITFGSCRRMMGDQDALEAFARRARDTGELPDLLALIGDQIYADDPSPSTVDWLAARGREEITCFADYVELYREAWSVPEVRWLLSTVSTLMMFDDHEIVDDWNSSATWLADISERPWWSERIRAGLTSYWLFQHAGNLSPAELANDAVWRAFQDGSKPVLTAYPWNVTLDLGRTRVLMLDCRGNRVLGSPRRMMPQEHWDRLARESQVDCDHLVIACSLPWLLPPAVHHGQAVMEVLSDRFALMERMRRKYDLEHWAAVGHSFAELTAIIDAVEGPATVTVLGGDVHHSYAALAELPNTTATVRQIVCSPLNHGIGGVLRLLLRIGWWRVLSGPAAVIARLLGVPRPNVRWRPLTKPTFANAIATITLNGRAASYRIDHRMAAIPGKWSPWSP